MTSQPLISFVVPCYNYGHFLAECVNSILAQDYENVEVLIMDNCSPDSTPDVARSFKDPRVRHIRNDSNIGHVRNYNKGITLAQGKYVWVLCADDVLRTTTVLRQFVEVMEQNADFSYVFCRALELQDLRVGKIIGWADYGEKDRQWRDASLFLDLILAPHIVMSAVMIRKEHLHQVGLFPVDLPFSDDWYIWSVLAMRFGAAYFAEPMVLCRIHQGSLTTHYSREYARNCIGDEFTVLWRLSQHSELAQKTDLRDACRAALVRRAKDYLKGGLWGAGARMSATEFEETLAARISDSDEAYRIRVEVYNTLAGEVESVGHVDDDPNGLPDEITVYWDLWRHAELASVASLTDSCKGALAHRLAYLLRREAGGQAGDLRGTEFADILQSKIPDEQAVKSVRALAYRDLAEQQFNSGEYERATQSYRLALQLAPGDQGISAKYLLMRMGTPGIKIRQLSHKMRDAIRRN